MSVMMFREVRKFIIYVSSRLAKYLIVGLMLTISLTVFTILIDIYVWREYFQKGILILSNCGTHNQVDTWTSSESLYLLTIRLYHITITLTAVTHHTYGKQLSTATSHINVVEWSMIVYQSAQVGPFSDRSKDLALPISSCYIISMITRNTSRHYRNLLPSEIHFGTFLDHLCMRDICSMLI
jgi:hypothetical protein